MNKTFKNLATPLALSVAMATTSALADTTPTAQVLADQASNHVNGEAVNAAYKLVGEYLNGRYSGALSKAELNRAKGQSNEMTLHDADGKLQATVKITKDEGRCLEFTVFDPERKILSRPNRQCITPTSFVIGGGGKFMLPVVK